MSGTTAAAPATGTTQAEAPKDTGGTPPVKQETTAAPKTGTEQPKGDLLTGPEETKSGSEATATEIEIKVPEGFEVDQGLLDAFKPLAKEYGLDSTKAQKLVDLYTGALKNANEKAEAAWNEQKEAWRNEAMKDKEIGGAKFAENVAVARKAIDKFGGPGLKEALNALGIGNHPEIIRFAARVGRAISEDSISGGTPGPAKTDDREAMLRGAFPSMYK